MPNPEFRTHTFIGTEPLGIEVRTFGGVYMGIVLHLANAHFNVTVHRVSVNIFLRLLCWPTNKEGEQYLNGLNRDDTTGRTHWSRRIHEAAAEDRRVVLYPEECRQIAGTQEFKNLLAELNPDPSTKKKNTKKLRSLIGKATIQETLSEDKQGTEASCSDN